MPTTAAKLWPGPLLLSCVVFMFELRVASMSYLNCRVASSIDWATFDMCSLSLDIILTSSSCSQVLCESICSVTLFERHWKSWTRSKTLASTMCVVESCGRESCGRGMCVQGSCGRVSCGREVCVQGSCGREMCSK